MQEDAICVKGGDFFFGAGISKKQLALRGCGSVKKLF